MRKQSTLNDPLQQGLRALAEQRWSDARRWLTVSTQRSPRHPLPYIGLGLVASEQGDFARAHTYAQKAMPLLSARGSAPAWARASQLWRKLGDAAQAHACAERALQCDPQNALGHLAAAELALAHNDPARTLDHLQHVPESERDAAWQFALAVAYIYLKRWSDALAPLQKCLQVDPRHANARNNLALVYKRLGQVERARTEWEALIRDVPDHLEANINLAALLMDGDQDELQRSARLLQRFEGAASLPSVYWHVVAQIQHRQKKWEQAHTSYRRALDLDPESADIRINWAIWHYDTGDLDTAQRLLLEAAQRAPEDQHAFLWLGSVSAELGDIDRFLTLLLELLQKPKVHPQTLFNAAFVLLGSANWREGFQLYQQRPSRVDVTAAPNCLAYATRLPDQMYGDTILVTQDQGIGDEWFFLRFVPQLAQRGAHLHYATTSKIAPLMQRIGWFEKVWTDWPPPTLFDAAINIGDLPFLLQAQGPEDPVPIEALPRHRDAAHLILAAFGPPPYVGVTWHGGTSLLRSAEFQRVRTLNKIIPIEALARWIPEGATVVSLQRNPLPGEIERLAAAVGRRVLDAACFNDDLEAMLGLLAQLDHYYAVSNANVHLAASLGLPCTVFVPNPPEWRWMLAGDRSPWFPNARIVRCGPRGAWPAPAEFDDRSNPAPPS
ncbi:tetratricopeptide repeat protein [Tepidimonas charontis]|nr:tetratricopeptide repeat protein [Tepidimonas charontis]